jgi:DNA-binding transcriptional regulator LsrR (DeoR family)
VRGPAHSKEQEANRYRVAAEDALQQLDWAIRYLHDIRQEKVAAVLAANRASIQRNLREASTSR